MGKISLRSIRHTLRESRWLYRFYHGLKRRHMELRLATAPWLASPQPRRLRLYCVGTPKSGTTSMAGVFSPAYRAAHEPLVHDLVHRFWRRRSWAEASLWRYLERRDLLLNLEVEASHPLLPCVGVLSKVFPESRFVLTVRDCYTWVESMINEEAETKQFRHTHWGHFFEAAFERPGRVHPPEEQPLRDRGLSTLGAYFDFWVRYHDTVVSAIPADRLLLLRTGEISTSFDRIGAFAGVPVPSLNRAESHRRQRPVKSVPLALLDLDYVTEVARQRAGPLMSRLFPDIGSARDVVRVPGR